MPQFSIPNSQPYDFLSEHTEELNTAPKQTIY